MEIFSRAEQGEFQLYTSSHTIATCFYVLKKFAPESELKTALSTLMDIMKIIPVDEFMLRKSMKDRIKDYEDAIQANCAYSIESITGIITRNTKDFKGCTISVLSPEELILH